MSKVIAISYAFLILVQSFNVNFEDISKIKTLLEHADYHQKNYGDSFLEFIEEHYGDEFYQHDVKHKEHDNLPFKDGQQLASQTNITFTINLVNYNIQYSSFIEIPVNFIYKESHSVFEKRSVFQPPKFA